MPRALASADGAMRGMQMRLAERLVLQRQRHLKWRAFDRLEMILMIMCGVLPLRLLHVGCLRHRHAHDRSPLAVVAGGDVDASSSTASSPVLRSRRGATIICISRQSPRPCTAGRGLSSRSSRIVVLCVALFLIYFGYINFLRGFGSFRMPSMTPIASLYAAIPISGVLIALFTIEQLVNGCHNGFEHPEAARDRNPRSSRSIVPRTARRQP